MASLEYWSLGLYCLQVSQETKETMQRRINGAVIRNSVRVLL